MSVAMLFTSLPEDRLPAAVPSAPITPVISASDLAKSRASYFARIGAIGERRSEVTRCGFMASRKPQAFLSIISLLYVITLCCGIAITRRRPVRSSG
jgi:hypothetical protein